PPSALLEVRDLSVALTTDGGPLTLVDHVSFSVAAGEVVGLVGESGAGKSITSRAVLGVLPAGAQADGEIWLDGRNLVGLTEKQRHRLRGKKVAFVSQEPMVSLDPTYRVGQQIAEAVRFHRGVRGGEARRIVRELLQAVRIDDPDAVARRYPHEISGGMAQRVCIAVALAGEPELLIADEPTTALDVTVQAEILGLLQTLRRDRGLAVLLVTHDWGVVADVCDRAVVLYAGQIVEQAPIEELFQRPGHPYTVALRQADPHQQTPGRRLRSIAGTVPPPGSWPAACRFAERCPLAVGACRTAPVPLTDAGDRHQSRCRRVDALRQENAHA
ncbi:ABC transporter ATP-binding protein, partial [Streptomyces sp. NPDC002491]